MRQFRNALILVAALCILSVFPSCRKKDNTSGNTVDVPVGIAVSLTGSFAPYGKTQQNGINIAIGEINDNSLIPGVRLVPWFEDDKSSPDTCRKIFGDLILNKKVLFIIGPTSSNSAFTADTVAQNKGVVVMGISNTVPGITEMGNFVFRNSLPESQVIPNTVRVTHDKIGYRKVAIVYGDDDPYTLGAYDAFKTSLEATPGVSIVTTQVVHKGDTLFGSQLAQVKDAGPDIIVLAALVNEASRLMVQARALGIPDSVGFMGGNSFNTSKLWQLAGKAAQGAICGTAWIKSEETPGNVQFVAKYTSLFGMAPDQFAAQAYAAIYIFADAMVRAGTVNRETLRTSLAGTSGLNTILGSFSFDPQRNPVYTPVVQQLINGEFVMY